MGNIMARNIAAADEAEEERIERKIVRVELDLVADDLTLIDVGDDEDRGSRYCMNKLLKNGWSIEKQMKTQCLCKVYVDEDVGEMALKYDTSQYWEDNSTRSKEVLLDVTLLVLVRKAPRNGD